MGRLYLCLLPKSSPDNANAFFTLPVNGNDGPLGDKAEKSYVGRFGFPFDLVLVI